MQNDCEALWNRINLIIVEPDFDSNQQCLLFTTTI